MIIADAKTYIDRLPLPAAPRETAPVSGVDLSDLPDGIVTGSNMIAFDPSVGAELRSSVALCLLAAQKVASADTVVASPDLWVQRHDMVLRGLNWIGAGGGIVYSDADHTGFSVHEAIIPFLVAAFGPGAAATSLIITALKQLERMDESTPWITLFDKESRRFDVSEYRFATSEMVESTVVLRLAAARFVAINERIQVLFFKFRDVEANMRTASAMLTASASMLEKMNKDLRAKLETHTADFIRALEL